MVVELVQQLQGSLPESSFSSPSLCVVPSLGVSLTVETIILGLGLVTEILRFKVSVLKLRLNDS